MTTLDGETVRMSMFAGRPVYINFWGTWCPPCVEELPLLESFAREQAALPDGAFMLVPLVGIVIALGMLLAEDAPATDVRATADPNRPRSGVAVLDRPLDDFVMTTLDGETVRMSMFAGRPVYINFWGTWCPPCVEELPLLEAFAREQAALPDGAVILASNNTETPEQIRAYFAENGLELPHILFVQDADSALYRWFGVFQMPTTYVADAGQTVRLVKYGAFSEADLAAYQAEITGLGQP
jgi:thiol-disulfide isomerase/thioredoxin